jgi:hypothetical protein
LDEDINGPLYFNPLTLCHHFFTTRLNHLLCKDDQDFPFFGDGVGNGPDFEIKGRGFHNDWYLFRLPIIDAYISNKEYGCGVTMGPILNDYEVDEIYRLSLKMKKEYMKKYKRKLPDLLLMKKWYSLAIDKNPNIDIPLDVLPFVPEDQIQILKHKKNVYGINQLSKL